MGKKRRKKTNRSSPDFGFVVVHGLEELFDRIEKYCYNDAIVTVISPYRLFRFDLRKDFESNEIQYGYDLTHKPFIFARTLGMIAEGEGNTHIVVRSFLRRKHPKTRLPYKEIRVFRAWIKGNRVKFRLLSPRKIIEKRITDLIYDTDNPPSPEVEAIYTDDTEKIFGETLLDNV